MPYAVACLADADAVIQHTGAGRRPIWRGDAHAQPDAQRRPQRVPARAARPQRVRVTWGCTVPGYVGYVYRPSTPRTRARKSSVEMWPATGLGTPLLFWFVLRPRG